MPFDTNYKSELPCPIRGNQTYKLCRKTTRFISSTGLAKGSQVDVSGLMEIIRICAASEDSTNLAELSLVARFIPSSTPLIPPDGILLADNMDSELEMESLAKLGKS